MALKNFPDLAQFASRRLPVGYPAESQVTLFVPEDNIPGALGMLIDSAEHSLDIAVHGFYDDTLATAVLRKLQDPKVFTRLLLSSPGAAGRYEERVKLAAVERGSSVLFGYAEDGLRLGAVDGLDCFYGGPGAVTFTREPMIAFQMRNKIDRACARLRQAVDAE